ncbi:hypothetical protein KUTeg_024724 [Tegillarca granosa]|uniref:Uncharacterized protein n=1 Tax=Tegillarca granosa TaxID=220873 RepID=A0ABQ9DY66_TEGGR|nr:hypothetical protein KUTeg_024724 [Tegillarca granosa]
MIVQSGSDLNFVNLWNLKGYAFNDGNGNLETLLLIDNIRIVVYRSTVWSFPNQWTIRLYKTENHSIYSWIQKVAFPYEYGDGKQMKINPNSNLVLHVFPEGQEDKIFCAVWYTTTGYSPKIYCAWTAVQASTVIAQLSNNQACSPLLTPNDTIDTTVHAALKMMLCSATELEQATNGRVQEAFFIEAEGYDDHLPDSLLFLLASGTIKRPWNAMLMKGAFLGQILQKTTLDLNIIQMHIAIVCDFNFN